jgi:2-phosphoglycerate kinase
MAAVLTGYLQVVDTLWPIMRGSPGVIVTIDGRDGVGKTTMGRFLAWYFNVSLIETDLFVIPAMDHFIYLDDQINRIIERRVTSPLPVIVEGVAMLQL